MKYATCWLCRARVPLRWGIGSTPVPWPTRVLARHDYRRGMYPVECPGSGGTP